MDNILKEKLEKIKLLICDVDGVLTDGTLIYTTNGEESKNFSYSAIYSKSTLKPAKKSGFEPIHIVILNFHI